MENTNTTEPNLTEPNIAAPSVEDQLKNLIVLIHMGLTTICQTIEEQKEILK